MVVVLCAWLLEAVNIASERAKPASNCIHPDLRSGPSVIDCRKENMVTNSVQTASFSCTALGCSHGERQLYSVESASISVESRTGARFLPVMDDCTMFRCILSAAMHSLRTLSVCLLASLLGCAALRADGLEGYTRHVWQAPDGLPEQTVQAFAQTPDGFLWVGTTGGLLRFDGAHFTLFDRQNTPSLHENNIFCLMVSRDGALWI